MIDILNRNIEKMRTTPLGVVRISRNIGFNFESEAELTMWCKNLVLHKNPKVMNHGKNYYVIADGVVITINSYSFTIITAHLADN